MATGVDAPLEMRRRRQILDRFSYKIRNIDGIHKSYVSGRNDLREGARKLNPSTTIYRDLDHPRKEIRIVYVQPGKPKSPIRGTFGYTYLVDDPPSAYETISYVWGDASVRGVIYIDGRLLDVPRSAEVVLRRMRSRTTVKALWIDSVCTNQANLGERSSQVALMAEIYSLTTQNLIWLGDDKHGKVKKSISAIQAVLQDMFAETAGGRNLQETLYGPNKDRIKMSNKPMSVRVDFSAILQFFDSPWFTRLWILQEASLPRLSVCFRSDIQIPLRDVLRVAYWIYHKWPFIGAPGQEIPNGIRCAMKTFHYTDEDCGWCFTDKGIVQEISAMEVFDDHIYGFSATDPRDHVYGKLGLLRRFVGFLEMPTDLTPDYTIPFQEVFRRAVRFIIAKDNDFNILTYVRRGNDGPHELKMPSWVPRWHVNWDTRTDATPIRSIYSADKELQMMMRKVSFSDDPAVLRVMGISVGTIVRTTIIPPRKVFNDLGFPAYQTSIGTLCDVASTYEPQNRDTFSKVVSHTLIGGDDSCGGWVDKDRSAQLCKAFMYYLLDLRRLPDTLPEIPDTASARAKEASTYYEAFYQFASNRRGFITNTRNFGLGPSLTEPGDVVAILFGCQYPCVLRPIDILRDTYEFIGNCFISEIMQGEAVDAWGARGDAVEVFNIY